MLHQRFSALCIELGWLLAAHDLGLLAGSVCQVCVLLEYVCWSKLQARGLLSLESHGPLRQPGSLELVFSSSGTPASTDSDYFVLLLAFISATAEF